MVAWSGHAVLDRHGELRLIARDTNSDTVTDQTYDAHALANSALHSGADQILVLLDTCHAGAAWSNPSKRRLPSGQTGLSQSRSESGGLPSRRAGRW